MAKNINDVLDSFQNAVLDLVDALKGAAAPVGAGEVDYGWAAAPVGAGEVDYGWDGEPVDGPNQVDDPVVVGDGITDDTQITMRSGDLREVIDAYRHLSRLAREGKIPTQEQRFQLHKHIRAVKHLIRKPRR